MSIFSKIGKGISKVAGKGGVIDKATRAVDKATGGISGKLLKTVEGVVKSVPIVGTAYTAATGIGKAMIKVADGTANATVTAKKEASKAITAVTNEQKTTFVAVPEIPKKQSFVDKIKTYFEELFYKYPWVKWLLIIGLPSGLLLLFFFNKRKKKTVKRRRTSVSKTVPKTRRKTNKSSAMSRKMARVRAARRINKKRKK